MRRKFFENEWLIKVGFVLFNEGGLTIERDCGVNT
jgi:hypothetical protein